MSRMRFLALLLALCILLSLAACGGDAPPVSADTPCTSADGHADTDDNGVCDACRISVVIYFDFFAINDLHGKICDTDIQPGVDEMTTYLKNARAERDNVILLSAGDMWQGSSESNLTKGLLTTEWMNELDFAAMALGNHEYDWGSDYIEENDAVAEFPLLAINVYDRATNKPVSYCEPSVLVEKSGLQIGIIGAIGDCYSSISREQVQDVYFKVGADLTALVKAEADKLRAAGADFIVYVLHDGYGQSRSSVGQVSDAQLASYYDVALSNGYVDLVFEGHTHQSYVLQDRYGVYHLQNGGDNKNGITHAGVSINFANGKTTVGEAGHVSHDVYTHLADDPIVDSLLEKYEEDISPAHRVLGQNRAERNRDTLRALLAKLYYECGVERWGDAYDIVLGGGYFSVRSPGYLAAGKVSYADLQMLFPFDNRLQLCAIKGADLLTRFFESDNENYFVYYEDYGEQVKRHIDPAATYYIVADTYSSSYAPNRLTAVADYDADVFARDLLADFIENGGFDNIVGGETVTPIPEILAIGATLKDNEETLEAYRARGRIVEISNTKYGNMVIEDEAGNRLTIYGTYDENGNRYDAIENPPVIGDTVTLVGPIKRYVKYDGTVIIELVDAVWDTAT